MISDNILEDIEYASSEIRKMSVENSKLRAALEYVEGSLGAIMCNCQVVRPCWRCHLLNKILEALK